MDTINYSQIDFGQRARSEYKRIDELAQSIHDHGLIQPVVLVPFYDDPDEEQYGLDAGGRRCRALETLLTDGRWDGILHHAVTSAPGRPGYILKGEAFTSPLNRALTELAENLDREDMDWRDETKLIVKAWKLALTDAHANSRDIIMRDGGAMLGCGYMDLRAAVLIHDDLIAHPETYKDCSSLRQALAKLSNENAKVLTQELAKRNLTAAPKIVVSAPKLPEQEGLEYTFVQSETESVVIALTQSFKFGNSLLYMAGTDTKFDHVVTDPDYGVSVERLEAGVDVQSGVHQADVDASVTDMLRFIELAFRVVRDTGFCVFFYDLDHHEKLQRHALDVGWRTQRWPLIWVKSDYRSNASPQSNFTKNVEYAIVLRKPAAVLSAVQTSSVFLCPSAGIQKRLNHPFAKPLKLSKWIYSAIAIKGQTVFDPFMGSGALAIAAAEWGLKPSGGEINSDNYNNAIVNLQNTYRSLLGPGVQFS